MEITFSKQERRVTVTIMQVAGKVDSSNYQDFTKSAIDAVARDAHYLLIDLSACEYMSSAGIRSLNEIYIFFKKSFPHDEVGQRAHRMKLLGPTEKLMNVFSISGVDAFFEIYGDLETAVASF